MGSWFSNMHIRKREGLSKEQVLEAMCHILQKEGCQLAASAEEADYGLALLDSPASGWFSVHSDLFAFEDPQAFTKLGNPCGKTLHTDILGIACMDSDYLYLNLLNPDEDLDAWVSTGHGKEVGIHRRKHVAGWKKKVVNYPVFREKMSQTYWCAEELLEAVADCLQLPPQHSILDYSALEHVGLQEQPTYLYFKLPQQEQKEPPRLQIDLYSLMPCEIGKEEVISCVNTGGRSRGVCVYFVGDYVEKDEITFENVQWQENKNGLWVFRPISLEKVRLADGQWAFRAHDPNYVIPPQVNPDLNFKKKMLLEFERAIRVRFTPRGNARKVLDITVVFVPDENPAGQAGWNVWAHHSSKQDFLKCHNETWARREPSAMIPEDSVDI